MFWAATYLEPRPQLPTSKVRLTQRAVIDRRKTAEGPGWSGALVLQTEWSTHHSAQPLRGRVENWKRPLIFIGWEFP